MECKVEFDYVAQEPDELTIKKGDIIKNVQTKMDGWFEGTLRGKTGVFPDNFVKMIEKPTPPAEPRHSTEVVVLRNKPSNSRRVRVLFSYAPEQDDELPLETGDVLDFIEEVEEGWWRGKLKGREGIFPSNFVEELDEPKTNGSLNEVHSLKPEEHKQKDTSRNSLTKGIPPVPDVVPDSTPSNRNSSTIEDEPAPELPPKPVRELARCFYPYTALNEDELMLTEGDIVTIISKNCEDEGWWRGELRGKIGLFPDNFVKIILPGDAQTGGGGVSGPHGKMLAQERNIVPPSDFPAKLKKDSVGSGGTSQVDGGGLSKSGGVNKTGESKIEQAKAQLSKTNSKEAQQPMIAPKVGHVATSPISPGIAAFHNNLFSNQKPPDAFAKSKDPPPVPRDDKASDESEDFNSVERTETLNHLTATRAKAPKRRPPSTIITRDNDIPLLNGSSHSYDNSITDSPTHSSTPMNHSSVTSNGTMSGSYTDGGSLNHSGSFHSHNNGRGDKEGSPTPSSANNSGVSVNKPKKQQQALPWMAELKQTQDKKRSVVSPGTTGGSPAPSATPPVTATPPPSTNIIATPPPPPPAATKEHAKAPPLPAKPSSLSNTGSPASNDKPVNNLNHTPTINNSSSSSPYNLSNKGFPIQHKKSLSPAPPPTTNNHNHLSSTLINSSVVDNSSHLLHGDGDNSNSNKNYVTFEEHQALKTRVTSLENEVETLKRQLKLLLDRDLRGHIV